MRRGAFVVGTVFATLLGAALLVTSARGSSVDPRRLVLQTSDVPAGFHLDRHSSRYFSNAAFGRGGPRLRKLVAKSGRITGYLAIYDHRVAPAGRHYLFTQVFWRAGRTVATIMTWGLSRAQTVELARVLQRRIRRTLG